jgi:hypothetical protein
MALNVECPACGDGLEVDEEYRGWTVRCPSCRHEFVAASDEPPRRGRSGRRRPRDEEPDDDEVIDDARAAVASPAAWLRVYGMLQVVGGFLGILLAGAMLVMVGNNPPPGRRPGQNADEVMVNIVLVGFCSVFAIVVGAVTTLGAGRMARLESHGWGMTAAVLSLGSILYCTCGLFVGIPIGIWALVVLNKAEVTDGFRLVARGRYRRRARDDEDEDEYGD